jgi:catechol 2,3-dioxygenase-like lactoylglutathione lyase family enzyme
MIVSPSYSHLAVSVADLDRAEAFYTQVLGFRAGARYRSAGRRVAAFMESDARSFDGVFMRLGDVLVELLGYEPPRLPDRSPRAADEVGYAHVSLVVDDVDVVVAEAGRHGGSLRTRFEHRFADGLTTIAFLADPDGNRIELIAHSTPAERAVHAEYLGLAELGWPATDAAASRTGRA